jgi:hypothetical protein
MPSLSKYMFDPYLMRMRMNHWGLVVIASCQVILALEAGTVPYLNSPAWVVLYLFSAFTLVLTWLVFDKRHLRLATSTMLTIGTLRGIVYVVDQTDFAQLALNLIIAVLMLRYHRLVRTEIAERAEVPSRRIPVRAS